MKPFRRKAKDEKLPLERYITNLIKVIIIPLVLVIVVVMGILFWYAQRYSAILKNVTTASEFNRNFKADIDLKMYYYVIESQYSAGLPIEEVQYAERLAKSLLLTTTEKDSVTAITSVINLSGNLKDKINQVSRTDNYKDRQTQLENNIYVLTDLVQTYMYDYLYYEAAHLNKLQSTITLQLEMMMLGITLLVALLLLVLVSKSRQLSRRITEPIEDLSKRVKVISSGDLSEKPAIQASEIEVQALSDGFERMVTHLNELIKKNKDEERHRRTAELALLQAQINPHFLYNTLDTIVWLIEAGDLERSVQMVGSLSNFFRFSMNRGNDVITLAEEEKHIRSYLEIQQIRYGDVMEYKIDIPPELGRYCLPKLTLQPLVENALYHGIKLKRGKGLITVTGRQEGECIVLTVSDNGAGMTPKRLEELRSALRNGSELGFGMRAIHKRLKLMFGEDYGIFDIFSAQGEGTQIRLRIPMWLREEGKGVS